MVSTKGLERALKISLALGWVWSATAVAISDPNDCEVLLRPPARGTLESYIDATRTKTPVTPRFVNPLEEEALAKKWKGVKGPALLQALLPKDCHFIDHKLLGSAGDGIVKDAGSGEFVMLRCFLTWNKQWVGFNVSVPVSSLMSNLNRSEKWLIGPEAEALLDWGHGGGTKTTGNHTTIGIMNHIAKYGVAVLGIDQPWHGEGARSFFKDEKDYFAFRLGILNKFVDAKVPVFGVGHSMGGIFADMMMRRSDDPQLNLRSRYKGFIPLAAVVDLLPGKGLKEKGQAERWKEAANKQEHLQYRIAPGDRALGETLIRDDKVSALSGLFVQFMNLFHDWSAPAHQGQEYLPTQFIWGDSDYLYVGNEDLIDAYLLNLKNVDLKVFGPRITFKGDVVQVGHLIFDHSKMVPDHPDATAIVLDYLAHKQIDNHNKEFARSQFFERFVKAHVSRHFWLNEENRGFVALYSAAYYWDPEFKAFAQERMKSHEVFAKALKGAKNPVHAAREAERAFHLQFVQKELPETYAMIREFVERSLGRKLTPKARDSESAVLANLLQAYASNLAFREYINNTEVVVEKVTPKFEALTKETEKLREFGELSEKIKKLSAEIERAEASGKKADPGKRSSLEASQTQLERVKAELQKMNVSVGEVDFQAQRELLDQIRKRTLIPTTKKPNETPADSARRQGEARTNIARRQELDASMQALRKEKDKARTALESVVSKRNRLENQLKDVIEKTNVPQVKDAYANADRALAELLEVDEQVRESVEKYMIDLYERQGLTGNWLSRLPADLQKLFDTYDARSQIYQRAVARVREVALTSARAGQLESGATETLNDLATTRREHTELTNAINQLDGQLWVKQRQSNILLTRYLNELVPGYITVERHMIVHLLDQPPENWAQVRGVLERAWGNWRTVWKERPPPEKVELY